MVTYIDALYHSAEMKSIVRLPGRLDEGVQVFLINVVFPLSRI